MRLFERLPRSVSEYASTRYYWHVRADRNGEAILMSVLSLSRHYKNETKIVSWVKSGNASWEVTCSLIARLEGGDLVAIDA
jgi:hypothetical protein